MSSKKAQENIVHTVQSGPIVADIVRGTSGDGHTYLYYQVSRAWQPRGGTRSNYSGRFYDRNERDHCKAVQEASKWMRANPQAADPDYESEPLAA